MGNVKRTREEQEREKRAALAIHKMTTPEVRKEFKRLMEENIKRNGDDK